MNLKYLWMAGEPDLHDMLHDEVVRAVMDRDGVSYRDLNELIGRVQRRLHGQGEGDPSARHLPTAANDSVRRHGW